MLRRWVFAILLTGCASGAPRMHERIGGASRTRPFASPSAYEAYLRAELQAHAGGTDTTAAERYLSYAELADPSDGYLPARRAELLLARGEGAEALRVLAEATAAHPDASAVWMVLAEARRATGDAAGAQAAATRAMALDPDDPDVRALAATIAGASEDTAARAREQSPNAGPGDRVLDPNSPFRRRARAARRQRAREGFRAGRWAEVDRILTPMVESGDGETADRVRLIEARAHQGRWRDAARLVPGVAVEGDGAVTRAERARLWLVAGHPEQARAEAEESLAEDGEDPRAELVLGESLGALGRWDLALRALGRITAREAEFAESREQAAVGLNLRGMRETALAVLDRALHEMESLGISSAGSGAIAGREANDRGCDGQ
ncbi:MAG: tetratricopeptide repeat protein [Tetrasphaera sp.]